MIDDTYKSDGSELVAMLQEEGLEQVEINEVLVHAIVFNADDDTSLLDEVFEFLGDIP